MSGSYRTSVLTFDQDRSISTLENLGGPAAVALMGTATGAVAWFTEGEFLRLHVAENDDATQAVNDGVLTHVTTLACLVAGDATLDRHQFVVAITPPANHTVKQFCQELIARAGNGLQQEGVVGPTALVAFEYHGDLILAESWPDVTTHHIFLERVLYGVAADMGFGPESMTLVMLSNGSARTRGQHQFVAA